MSDAIGRLRGLWDIHPPMDGEWPADFDAAIDAVEAEVERLQAVVKVAGEWVPYPEHFYGGHEGDCPLVAYSAGAPDAEGVCAECGAETGRPSGLCRDCEMNQ